MMPHDATWCHMQVLGQEFNGLLLV
jgi:hypothetical protein